MMISGPRQLRNDIDVYLSLLIEDLTKLWDEGVVMFDRYRNETFNLHAMLFFFTINDFLACGNLSGYSIVGHRACPIYGRKTIYTQHQCFLKPYHPY